MLVPLLMQVAGVVLAAVVAWSWAGFTGGAAVISVALFAAGVAVEHR